MECRFVDLFWRLGNVANVMYYCVLILFISAIIGSLLQPQDAAQHSNSHSELSPVNISSTLTIRYGTD